MSLCQFNPMRGSQGSEVSMRGDVFVKGLTSLAVGALMVVAPVGATTITRVDAYDYDSTSGLVSKHIIEPTNGQLCVAEIYSYDTYGNKTGGITRNCNATAGTYPGSSSSTNSEASPPPLGSSASFTQRSGNTSYTYNADGSVTVVNTNAVGDTETRLYGSKFGQLLKLTGPNGLVTQWAYDGLGRKTMEVRADGNGTTWTYEYCAGFNGGAVSCPINSNADGSGVSMPIFPRYVVTEQPIGPALGGSINIATQSGWVVRGGYTKVYYDASDRPTRTETQGFDKAADGSAIASPTLVYQDTIYDRRGQVSQTTRPYFVGGTVYWVINQYDSWGRLMAVVHQPNTLVGYTRYTYNGLASGVINVLGKTTTKTRNVVGQVIQVTDPDNKNLYLTYDGFGNLVQSTDSAGNVVAMQYDVRGRKYAMQDPDLGSWTYSYDALGELVSQTDAKKQQTTFSYDKLGRLIAKSEPQLNTNWYYNQNADGSPCTAGKGKLCEATSNNGYDRKHNYDSNGRVSTIATQVGGTTYTQTWTYNSDGRVLSASTNTMGVITQNMYTPLGYLWQVVDNAQSPTRVFWRAQAMDAESHLTQYIYGNNVSTTSTYDPHTGKQLSSVAGSNVQNISYVYDELGNLKTRTDALTTVKADYVYDAQNRLTTENLSGGSLSGTQSIGWTYDAGGIGNIQTRSDVGTYTYNPSGANSVRPHAVTSIAGTVDGLVNPVYSYDSNGNLTGVNATGGNRTVTWTSYNMVDSVSQTVGGNTNKLAFLYGPEHDRIQESYTKNAVLQRTITYLNAGSQLFYEEEKNNLTSVVKRKHYINAGDLTIGIVTYDGTAYSTQYWHKDHMGSPMVITDASGNPIERLAYEPFGKRRNANGTTDVAGTLSSSNTARGYTEQEMMDEVGLINMNGRIYDPAISRFLSADPTVQAPQYLQSYNRYSYSVNNPLKYFDPTGFTFGEIGEDPYNFDITNYGSDSALNWEIKQQADDIHWSIDSSTQSQINNLGIPLLTLGGGIGGNTSYFATGAMTLSVGGINGIGVTNFSGIILPNQLDLSGFTSNSDYVNSSLGASNYTSTVVAGGCWGSGKNSCAQVWATEGFKGGAALGGVTATACALATEGACIPAYPYISLGMPIIGAAVTGTAGAAIDRVYDFVHRNEADNGANSEEGCIYCVKGDKTSSGKDYVGSTDNMGNRQRDKSDGRDRQGAEVVDTYPKGDRDARRTKEQQAINDRGGVDKLDNRRNEVAPRKWPDKGITPP